MMNQKGIKNKNKTTYITMTEMNILKKLENSKFRYSQTSNRYNSENLFDIHAFEPFKSPQLRIITGLLMTSKYSYLDILAIPLDFSYLLNKFQGQYRA